MPSGAKTDSSVTKLHRGPHLARRRRWPARAGARPGPAPRPSRTLSVAGRRLGRQPVLAGLAARRARRSCRARGREPAARGDRRAAPARRGAGATWPRSSRTLLWPGTETPRRRGDVDRRRCGPSTVTSATAGPASGLTSSSTESCSAPAPTPVNHWSGEVGRAGHGGQLAGAAEAGTDQAGGQVALAGDHERPGARAHGRHRPRRQRGQRRSSSRRATSTSPCAPCSAVDERSRPATRAARWGSTIEALVSAVRVGRAARRPALARAHQQQRPTVSSGSTTASTVVASRRTRRLERSGRPGVGVAHARRLLSWSARRARRPPRSPAPCRTSSSDPQPGAGARRRRAGRAAGRPARPGWSGPRRWPAPARRWRRAPAATLPSAGAGSTTYSMPRLASASTTSGVGRETSARTSRVKPASSAVRSRISSSPSVTPSPRRTRVGQAVGRRRRGPPGCRGRGRASSSAPCTPGCRSPAVSSSAVVGRRPRTSRARRAARRPRPRRAPAAAPRRQAARSRRERSTSACAPRRRPPRRRPGGPRRRKPRPGAGRGGGQVEGDGAEHRRRPRPRPAATIQQTSTGIRVERGISASTASTAEHGAQPPGGAEVADPAGEQVAGVDDRRPGAGPPSSSSACAGAVQRAPAATTARAARGTTASAVAGGPQTERSRTAPRARSTAAAAMTTSPSRSGEEPQATGRERRAERQQQRRCARPPASGGPARGRRSRGRRGPATAAGRRRRRSPSRPSPQAPLTHRAPARRSPRPTAAASAARRPGRPSRPTTRRNRQAPHRRERARRAARSPRPRPRGCRRAAWPSSASGRTYAGAGTACPARAGARTRSAGATSRRRPPGTGERPPPVTEPNAARAPTSASTHEQREQHGDRVGEEAGHEPGVLAERVLVGSCDRRGGPAAAAGSASAAGGAAALGDVLGLVGRRGRRGRRRSRGRGGRAARSGRAGGARRRGVDLARRCRGAPGREDLARAGVERDQRRRARRAPRRRSGPAGSRSSAAGCRARAGRTCNGSARGAGVGQQREERGAALLVVRVPPGQRRAPDAAVRGLGVEDHGLRHDERSGARPRRRASRSRCRCRRSAAASSKPPSSSSTRRRTSMPAVLTASTVRTSSCWPWSYSPRSRPVSRRPVPEMVTPSSSSRLQRGPLAQLGAEHVGVGVAPRPRPAAPRARPGAGLASSWRSQTHSAACAGAASCSRPSAHGGGVGGRRRGP